MLDILYLLIISDNFKTMNTFICKHWLRFMNTLLLLYAIY